MIIKSKYLKREDIQVLADFLKLKMPSPNIEDKSLASSQVSKSQADIDKSQKLEELVDEQRKLSFSAEQHEILPTNPLLRIDLFIQLQIACMRITTSCLTRMSSVCTRRRRRFDEVT